MPEPTETSESIVLHFGTKPHEIEAKTLLDSFGALEAALTGIARHGHPDARLSIKVKSLREGSFEVPIEISQLLLTTGLTITCIDWVTAKESVKILIELIKLKLALKGKEPSAVKRDGNTVEIHKTSKSTINVDQRTFNIYVKDAAVGDAIARSFKALEADAEVKSFKVLDKERTPLLEVPRKAFPQISKPAEELPEDEEKVIERIELPIFKVVFGDGYKWEFYYRGIKIAATIADANFLERVKQGERFGRGDTLDADLEILRKFDERAQTYINKSYKVLLVHGIKRRSEQMALPNT